MSNSGFFTSPIRLDCDWMNSTRKQATYKMNPPDITTITTSLSGGTFVIKGFEYFYLFASLGIYLQEFEATYLIVIERSKDIQGSYLNNDSESWLDNKYSLFPHGKQEEPGHGHSGFFSENDTDFVLYYAYPCSGDGAPLLNINPLYSDDEGWPTLDNTSGDLFQRLKYITP